MGGLLTGFLQSAGQGIMDRKKQLHDEDIERDKMTLQRLQNEINSPYFNPDHLPDVMGQMDDIVSNMGKPKPKAARKPGLFSALLQGGQDALGVPSQPLTQSLGVDPGTYLSPAELSQRHLNQLQAEEDIKNKAAIKLQQEKNRRPTWLQGTAAYEGLPLGTVDINTGLPVEPPKPGEEPKKYKVRQVGEDGLGNPQYEAMEQAPPAAKTRQVWQTDPTSSTGYTAYTRNMQTGELTGKTPDITPPAGLLPSIHEGVYTYVDEDNNVVQIPTRSVTSKQTPGGGASSQGGLPAIPPLPSAGATGPPKVVGGPARAPAGSGGGFTPAQARQAAQFVYNAAEKAQYDPEYPEGTPKEKILDDISQKAYGMSYADIQKSVKGQLSGRTSERQKLQNLPVGKSMKLSDGRTVKKTSATGYVIVPGQ